MWGIKEDLSAWGGALSTAGDVVFYGTMEGWLKAVNAKTGDVLWKFKTPSGIIGNPMTYVGPDGKQYVAVLSGIGGWSGIGVAADMSLEDPTAGLGAIGAFKDLGELQQPGRRADGVLAAVTLGASLGSGLQVLHEPKPKPGPKAAVHACVSFSS